MVSQDPVLFSGSVRDNISYGLPGCSLDEIQEAARRANAHDFIVQLQKGYDTGELLKPAVHVCTEPSVVIFIIIYLYSF